MTETLRILVSMALKDGADHLVALPLCLEARFRSFLSIAREELSLQHR